MSKISDLIKDPEVSDSIVEMLEKLGSTDEIKGAVVMAVVENSQDADNLQQTIDGLREKFRVAESNAETVGGGNVPTPEQNVSEEYLSYNSLSRSEKKRLLSTMTMALLTDTPTDPDWFKIKSSFYNKLQKG